MSFDGAFDFLVEHLRSVAKLSPERARQWRQNHQQGDLHVPDAAFQFWRRESGNTLSFSEMTDEHYLPFYDAAWEMSRMGVLRFGQVLPRGQALRTGGGDVYSLTRHGIEWLAEASRRQPLSPSRMAELFRSLGSRFGEGFIQRATEAVSAYRASNYLSACVMCGAAAESILLALAIGKDGNEANVLKTYRSSNGRRDVSLMVRRGVKASLGEQLQTALSVLHYWRDDAAHGTMTEIGEIQAFNALFQLQRLSQFASQHWSELTASGV